MFEGKVAECSAKRKEYSRREAGRGPNAGCRRPAIRNPNHRL